MDANFFLWIVHIIAFRIKTVLEVSYMYFLNRLLTEVGEVKTVQFQPCKDSCCIKNLPQENS